VDARDLRPIRAFVEEHAPRAAYVVCNEPFERVADGIRITPWRDFLGRLWASQVVG
jgi:hypothetical protein